jgi:hypothetical protein
MVARALTDEEVSDPKQFCEENQCSQYSVMKSTLKEILFEPIVKIEEKYSNNEDRSIVKNWGL